MTIIMLIFTMALFFGSVGTPLARNLAIKSGFIALPKADRAHEEPTALMGGLAIYAAAIVALLAMLLASPLIKNVYRISEFASIIIAASLLAALGLWDDRRALPPWAKLAGQLIPAVLVFMAGVRVSSLPLPIPAVWKTALQFVITLAWILYITNAINFLDNADGVAVMTSATTSAIFLLIAILNGQQLVSILAAAVLGASLGFARYNLPLPKSTIFMGDSGSLFLGFLLAVLGIKIRIPGNVPEITWMVPIIVLALPIFDTVLVYISRKRRNQSFFKGGVDHSTHRLSRYGLDKLSVALAVGLINGVLGLIAIFVTQASSIEAGAVAMTLAGIAVYSLWRLEFKASFWFRTGKEPAQLTPVAIEGKG
ncbi:MAG: undecaprenyl/decaprenyl-phosphate alpha-N-acetylglucosaminyl 1-phosphate transferase [Anaerolineaceae bacterium]|nr:undecaprenyl/decaprenyl-phosphate alpha-N-acetylglucosaminyl 1-phosphate transferase [Anaerolineaceae bacterium]